jgi:TIR domain
MAHDVFVSYSSKDKITADAVCATLEANGIRCWIAPRDVTAGLEWGECIIEAIEQSRVMVLVFTSGANTSPQIRREVERAVNRGVVVVPLRVENVLPGRALEYFIGNVHWLDALTPPLEKHLEHLAGTIKVLLARMLRTGS